MLSQGPKLSRFIGITYSYVELLLQSVQFAECHRTMHFHDMQVSLPINISEDYKRILLKV